jgi:hypothetical protein
MTTSNLILHCGGASVERGALALVPTPEPEATWCPIPHESLVIEVEGALERANMRIVTEAHGLSADGSRYSDAQEPLLRFVEALVAYAPNRAELERICIAIWPECDIYKGHTHWRVMPEGQTI